MLFRAGIIANISDCKCNAFLLIGNAFLAEIGHYCCDFLLIKDSALIMQRMLFNILTVFYIDPYFRDKTKSQ